MPLLKNNYSIEPDLIKWPELVTKKFGSWPNFDTNDLMGLEINTVCNNLILTFESFLTKGKYNEKEKAWYHMDAGCWQLKLLCEEVKNFEWKRENKNKKVEVISKNKKEINVFIQTNRYGTIKFKCQEILALNFNELETKKLWRLKKEDIEKSLKISTIKNV